MDLSFYITYMPILARGAVMTIELTLVATFFGTILGVIAALGRISGSRVVSSLAYLYTWAIRGTPLLLQLFFIYYGLPQVGIRLDPFPAAVIGMSVCAGAYIAEIVRAGIQSIDKGQMEAARSLGMTYFQAMLYVVLPQAYRRLIPPMGNEIIALTKDSSLVSTLAMVELLRTAKQIDAATLRSMEAYIAAGLYYLAITTGLTVLFDHVEKRLAVYE
ncbi:amino acid ABC transporter permease [Gelria sp. Kuro-4]|uniref:amino acid ABC transporter permease n=1 Tax=Gelria sp. Kuro-4 TaxID=2796927 RepID=UPI001BF06E62|nr:amino acid ABC transporter permease [Gelria sp. Kuro-4]BCV25606.1 glutamine ABC transporter permease [Gelria sp. Kuro-4]